MCKSRLFATTNFIAAGIVFWGTLAGCSQRVKIEDNPRVGTPILAEGDYRLLGPAWDQNGSRIAVSATKVMNSPFTELFIVEWPGGAISSKFSDPHGSFDSPSWSPDGKRIAFGSMDKDPQGVWILDLPSGATEYVGKGLLPTWRNDREVAIARQLSTLDAVNSGLTVVVVDTVTGIEHEIFRFTEGAAIPLDIAWSPDSHLAAIALSNCMGDLQNCSDLLFLVDVQQETSKLLRTAPIGYDSLNWSSNNMMLSYVDATPSNSLGVTKFGVIDLKGNCVIRRIAQKPIGWPDWTTNGKMVTFIGSDGLYAVSSERLVGQDFWSLSGDQCD